MIKIFSPSYKRANKPKITEWLRSVILAVHEFEAEEYRKFNDNELLVIPDPLRGNMAKIRNFILDSSDADTTVMMDDDVSCIGYYEKMKPIIIDETFLLQKITEWGEQARELDTVLFGINLQSDPKFYREYSPISLLSPVLGPFCCIRKTKLRYDNRLGLNEDYDFALQVLRKHHKILRWNKFYYMADHLTLKGGCASYRTRTREIEQSKIMLKKWGNNVVKYNFVKSTNPRLNCPYKGI